MKIQKIFEKTLPKSYENIYAWEQWIKIRNSGKFSKTEVGGDFQCDKNQLTSIKGSPLIVDGGFKCSLNLLQNLIGGPERVGWSLNCSNNLIETINGFPKWVGENINSENNQLTSLQNIHKQILHIGGFLNLTKNPIKSHILGILLIKELKEVYANGRQFTIINDHIEGDKDVLECQEELISAGYKEFAKL